MNPQHVIRKTKRKPAWTVFHSIIVIVALSHLILFNIFWFFTRPRQAKTREYKARIAREDELPQKPGRREPPPGADAGDDSRKPPPDAPKHLPPHEKVPDSKKGDDVNAPVGRGNYIPPVPGEDLRQAYAYLASYDYRSAEEKTREMLEKDPLDCRALVALGEIYERKGNFRKAVKAFKQAHDAEKRDTMPLDKLVVNLMMVDEPDQALEYFEKLETMKFMGKFEKDLKAEIYLQRGARRRQNGDSRWNEDALEAEKLLTPILEDNGEPEFWASKGKLEILRDNPEEAVKAFEKSLETGKLALNYKVDILSALFFLHARLGNEQKASDYINELVALMDEWKPGEFSRSLYIREFALLFDEIMLENRVEPGKLFTHRRYYKKLYGEKLKQPEVEVDQTLYILSEMVDMEWDESLESVLDEVNEFMSLAHGPRYPECYFNIMINRPMRYMLGYIQFGDVYYRFNKADKAMEYYDKALKLSPGNPLIIKRIKRAEKLKGPISNEKGPL